ncbi:MAG TPA: hypothetical protein VF594_01535 [Rubricoccaceae bacterium]
MRLAALVFALCCAAMPPARAQTAPAPGSCVLGRAQATLDIGDVEARIFNTGSLFYGNSETNAYYVPKAEGRSPIYLAGLWVAGKVGGQLRVAGGTYGPPPGMDFTFWPGPLGDDARPVNPSDCSAYDRIYTVSRPDLARYNGSGTLTDDLRDWPWQLGAPVLDGDGDPSNYNLAGGDQPAIRGDQMTWSLTNDVGNVHPEQETPPLGIELRTEAIAFALGRLDQTTVYRYTFTNRTDATIESMYVGMFIDPDLGDATDDYVGTDTTRGMAFAYNADNQDGTGGGTSYGIPPPAVGLQMVEGPVGLPNGRDDDRDGQTDEPGERLGMTAAVHPRKSVVAGTSGEPQNGVEIYRTLQGRWVDDSAVREFGDGYQESQGIATRFSFPGDPVTGRAWSEVNTGRGASAPGDRRFTVATGPFRLAPGQSETVTVAIPFGRGTTNFTSITELRRTATAVSSSFEAGYFEPQRVGEAVVVPVDQAVRLGAPSPNPFSGRAAVRYAMPAGTRLRATLLDVLGREIAVLADGPTTAAEGEIAVAGTGLAPGVYRVRVVVPGAERFVTLVHIR